MEGGGLRENEEDERLLYFSLLEWPNPPPCKSRLVMSEQPVYRKTCDA